MELIPPLVATSSRGFQPFLASEDDVMTAPTAASADIGQGRPNSYLPWKEQRNTVTLLDGMDLDAGDGPPTLPVEPFKQQGKAVAAPQPLAIFLPSSASRPWIRL